jgi:amphi-Trp domain-containing protein
VKWEERRAMNREEVARVLRVFSEAIAREGVVEYLGHRTAIPEEMEVEVEYKEKHGKCKFEIELKWRG